jgi:nitrogen fixation/metabolism regulation signal transduction histidine kinase
MKNFADIVRVPKPNRAKVDLLTLINSIVILMKSSTENKIEWIIKESISNYAMVDPLLFEQVIINIFKNGIEAINSMRKDHLGVIKVEIVGDIDKVDHLIVSNNGIEIKKCDENTIFSPFFSTKRNGQGIGLTLIREILTGHGLRFSLKTDQVDKYTKFRIEF